MVFGVLTSGVLIFSYQKRRQFHVRIWESQIEVPKILKIEQNDQNQRKFLFYFSSLRGRGKSSAMISEVKLTHFLILFFFRNLKMRFRHASCRNFRKKSYLCIQIEENHTKKVIISQNSQKQMSGSRCSEGFF